MFVDWGKFEISVEFGVVDGLKLSPRYMLSGLRLF